MPVLRPSSDVPKEDVLEPEVIAPSPGPAQAAPPPAVKQTSGAAMASLILGLLSFLCGFSFLTSVPAIICGHMGRARVRSDPEHYTGGGLALAGLIMGYAVTAFSILLVIAMLLPAVASARGKAREVQSLSNVQQIAMSCMLYAEDHEGLAPPDLATLASEFNLETDILRSPFSAEGEAIGYELVFTGNVYSVSSPGEVPLIREIPVSPRGNRAVAYCDGHAESVSEWE